MRLGGPSDVVGEQADESSGLLGNTIEIALDSLSETNGIDDEEAETGVGRIIALLHERLNECSREMKEAIRWRIYTLIEGPNSDYPDVSEHWARLISRLSFEAHEDLDSEIQRAVKRSSRVQPRDGKSIQIAPSRYLWDHADLDQEEDFERLAHTLVFERRVDRWFPFPDVELQDRRAPAKLFAYINQQVIPGDAGLRAAIGVFEHESKNRVVLFCTVYRWLTFYFFRREADMNFGDVRSLLNIHYGSDLVIEAMVYAFHVAALHERNSDKCPYCVEATRFPGRFVKYFKKLLRELKEKHRLSFCSYPGMFTPEH